MWLYFKLALAEFLLRSTGDHFPVIFISWGVMALRMPPPTSLVEVSLCSSAAQHGLPLCHEPLVRDCFSGLGAAQMPSLGNQLHVGTARTSTTTLWIPLTKLQLHLLEDEEWYFTALKISCFNLMYILSSYWLCLSLKKSSHASSCIFSSPLCSCWHQNLYSFLVKWLGKWPSYPPSFWHLPGKNCFLASLILFPNYHSNYLHIHKGPGSTVISEALAT